jgi:hypothetical protein
LSKAAYKNPCSPGIIRSEEPWERSLAKELILHLKEPHESKKAARELPNDFGITVVNIIQNSM